MAMLWEFLFIQLFWERLSNKTKTNYLLISKTKTKVISWLLSTLDRKNSNQVLSLSMCTAVSTKVVPQKRTRQCRLVLWVERVYRWLIKVHGFYQQEKRRHKYICLLFRFMSLKHLKPESRTMNPHYPKHLLALSSTVLRHSILNSSI